MKNLRNILMLMLAASAASQTASAQGDVDYSQIKDYIIEVDCNALVAKATLLWGADKEGKNFKRWEIYEGGNLRMFNIKNGTLENEGDGNNVGIPNGAPLGQYHHMKIEVSGANHVKTYVNDVLVDERDGNYPFGYLGFYADAKDWNDWVNGGAIWLDELKVTDGEENTLLNENFSDGSCFSVGSPTGGCYYSWRTTDWTVLQTSESFNASDTKNYTFEAKVGVERGTPDLVFGSDESGNNFQMYRLNPDGNYMQYFCKTNGNFSALAGIDLDASIFSDRYRLHDFKIVVSEEGTMLTSYIDGVQIDQRSGNFAYGRIGYNSDIPANEVGRPVRAYFDNVKVTLGIPAGSENEIMALDDNSEPQVVFTEDFEDPANVKFSGKGGNVYGGQLMMTGHTSWDNPSYFWQEKDFTTTGINTVTANPTQADNIIYDLMGRKVLNPSKGIYIKNGKKIVIR